MLVVSVWVQHAHVPVYRHADQDNGALLTERAPEQRLERKKQHFKVILITEATKSTNPMGRGVSLSCWCLFF
jgi:hypothetical protein